jgi:hypothetical protein
MARHGSLSSLIPDLNKLGEEKQNNLNIDYPQVGEPVARGHYAIRISGCEGECQVTIDGTGVWQECRRDGGFQWFDWTPSETGAHRISVRARAGNKWVKTDRTCRVV